MKSKVTLDERLEALANAHALASQRLDSDALAKSAEVLERSAERRTLSAQHTVVGFFGATGSGKSTLLNAVAGVEVATASARRPTTSEPLAAIWGSEGSQALLDWLDVRERKIVAEAGNLILLDLPDIDSVTLQHRIIAERLAGMVDVLVWVLDPQKYADQVIHEDFVQPLAGHGAVTLAVLNQIDRLQQSDRAHVLSDVEKHLENDGLHGVTPIGVSALTGEGLDELIAAIDAKAQSREAAAERITADIKRAGDDLMAALGEGSSAKIKDRDVNELTDALATAARAPQVADAAAASYRHRAHRATGIPGLRKLATLGVDPLKRLGLSGHEESAALRRTSLPVADAASMAAADAGIRAFADKAASGASESWRRVIRSAARSNRSQLPDALDQAVARTDLRTSKQSWWWSAGNLVQWLGMLSLLAGLLWLTGIALGAYFQMPLPPAPRVEGLGVPIPLPTMLVIIGVLVMLLMTLLWSSLAFLASRREKQRVLKLLRANIKTVANDLVVTPVREELDRAEDLREALQVAMAK